MSLSTIKTRFKSLLPSRKIVLVGSFLLTLSALLPWYTDIDRHKTGDTFLGVTGPLYLAGFIVLIAGLASMSPIVAELIDRKFTRVPFKNSQIYIISISISLLMLIIVASVYFHPKFGVNISQKSAGVGMIMALVGIGVMIAGTVVALKNAKSVFTTADRHHDSLASIGLEDNDIQEPIPVGSQTVQQETVEEAMANQYGSQKVQVPRDNRNAGDDRFSYFSGRGIQKNNINDK